MQDPATQLPRTPFWRSSHSGDSRQFADVKKCLTGILSLPNVGWDMDSEEDPVRKVIASH
jgi:hypothetical protein